MAAKWKRAQAAALTRGEAVPHCGHSVVEPWSCDCMFGCGSCGFAARCLACGDYLRAGFQAVGLGPWIGPGTATATPKDVDTIMQDRLEYARLRKSCRRLDAAEFNARAGTIAHELADGEDISPENYLTAARILCSGRDHA